MLRVFLFAFPVVLALATAFAPEHREAPDISELFDPAAVARNLCGPQAPAGGWIAAAAQETLPQGAAARLLDGYGDHSFAITTSQPEAQAFFDQGLRAAYAFNFGEAVAAFRAAARIDPVCAMCFWGEALALGPNLNASAMTESASVQASAALEKAQGLALRAGPREGALIAALMARYSADPSTTRAQLDAAYADAMARTYESFPGDADIAVLYAAAAMNDFGAGAWWLYGGRLPSPRIAAAMVALEDVLRADPTHPGAVHYYIHAVGSSTKPERAAPYIGALAAEMPAAGHMVHMASHTTFRLGRYREALESNLAAIAIDEAYLSQPNNASRLYAYQLVPHNIHFAMAAAEMAGDGAAALALARKMDAFLAANRLMPAEKPEVMKAAALHPLVRFAPPADILALPEPSAAEPLLRGIWHYARGTAYARLGDAARAAAEADAIAALGADVPLDQLLQSYWLAPRTLMLAEEILRGRIAGAQGDWVRAAQRFTDAVAVQDTMRAYDPPNWSFPAQQPLGIALMKAGRPDEAVTALRAALLETPNNGVVLYALREASAALGDAAAVAEYDALFAKAWAGAEPPDLDRF